MIAWPAHLFMCVCVRVHNWNRPRLHTKTWNSINEISCSWSWLPKRAFRWAWNVIRIAYYVDRFESTPWIRSCDRRKEHWPPRRWAAEVLLCLWYWNSSNCRTALASGVVSDEVPEVRSVAISTSEESICTIVHSMWWLILLEMMFNCTTTVRIRRRRGKRSE